MSEPGPESHPDVSEEPFYSFRAALSRMQTSSRIATAPAGCSTELGISGLMKANDGDQAIYFPDIRQHDMPVVGNVLASQLNCEAAFGTDYRGIRGLVARGLAKSVDPVIVDDGPVRDVQVLADMDLGSRLPVLTHAPGDSGRFVTAGVVIVRHPHTGVYNASYHRLQLLDGNRAAIKIDLGRHLRSAFESARSDGTDLPISVAIGADVTLLYAAAVMGSRMPEGKDEIKAAGAMQGGGLRMLHGLTQDVLVPAFAEIALEGTISTSQTVHEGPFGEFMGYHSEEGPAPVVEFTALTHRRDPIYYAINGAGRETVMLRKYVLEASLLDVLQTAVPIVTDVNITTGGMHRFHLNIAVKKTSDAHDGLERNAALAAFGTLKDLIRIVIVDDDIDVHSEVDVEYAMATRVEASRDVVVIPEARGHEYVRVFANGVGAKWFVDATVPYSQRERFQRIDFAKPTRTPLAAASHIPGLAEPRPTIHPGDLRRAMGRFITGVAVVTTGTAEDPHGMTVNSLTSVSLDPPLVLVSLDRYARSTEAVRSHSAFAVNVLSVRQEQVALRFSRRGEDHFDGLSLEYEDHHVPVVPGALAHVECLVDTEIEAGDHVLFLGRVVRVCDRDGDPLAFFTGRFGAFAGSGDAETHWFF